MMDETTPVVVPETPAVEAEETVTPAPEVVAPATPEVVAEETKTA